MDPVLAEIYSTVLEAAPFVIAAFALIWLILVVYVAAISNRLRQAERDLVLLEERLDEQLGERTDEQLAEQLGDQTGE